MTVCIIPARAGSKRIKNKNVQKVNGHPLIGLAIRIAKKANIFSQIVVSTDCKKIASIAKKYGAQILFLRSKNLSGISKFTKLEIPLTIAIWSKKVNFGVNTVI